MRACVFALYQVEAKTAKIIQEHAVEHLQQEVNKQKLHATQHQALQEDDTPTHFNDPFLDNGTYLYTY